MKQTLIAAKLMLSIFVLGHAQEAQASPPPVVIAIIDTGLDARLADFQPYLWRSSKSPLEYGWNFKNNSSDITDDHGHGTHVAGIIVKEIKRLSPLIELHRPIQLMILSYYSEEASGELNLKNSLKAFRYALDHGATVINYSGGGLAPSVDEENLVKEAERRGVILIAAAGNEGMNSDRNPFYPANYPASNVVSVGALDRNQAPLPSTNYGKRNVDLMTEGQKVTSLLPGGRTGAMTGTSQATAFVTATVALLLASRMSMPRPIEVIDHLFLSTSPSEALTLMTRSGGRLNAERSLTSRDRRQIASDERLRNAHPLSDKLFAAD